MPHVTQHAKARSLGFIKHSKSQNKKCCTRGRSISYDNDRKVNTLISTAIQLDRLVLINVLLEFYSAIRRFISSFKSKAQIPHAQPLLDYPRFLSYRWFLL